MKESQFSQKHNEIIETFQDKILKILNSENFTLDSRSDIEPLLLAAQVYKILVEEISTTKLINHEASGAIDSI